MTVQKLILAGVGTALLALTGCQTQQQSAAPAAATPAAASPQVDRGPQAVPANQRLNSGGNDSGGGGNSGGGGSDGPGGGGGGSWG
ncbi:hypothetical protein [Roseibium denhamense]|uniref:Lipoprotein n=1 Tax=Roseibium denhamense TaxID=76305 RepID=A0ABY1NRC1_9HYPH|nr:hypothetical protein [Roseibium denhamense]SMP15902.1 hypothetical protein SAMN06265374_1635 [Roseibium denhamense]